MRDIAGSVVVVTGAASGIGRGLVERFAEDGAKVVIADIDLAAARSVAAAIGGDAEPVEVDVTSEASVERMVAATIERWGRIDVLCANAGIYPSGMIESLTEEEWDTTLGVNLKGSFFSIKHVVPHMRKQRSGRIVVTSSITGPVVGFPGWSHYGAAKSGLLGMIKSVALELAADGITINAVMPGNVRTPTWSAENPAEFQKATEDSIPVGRLAEAADIANVVRFFADPASGYVTGQSLIVDGGQTLPESPLATGND